MHIANIFWACVNKIKTNICNFHGNNFTIYNIFFIGWDRYQNRLLYVWLAPKIVTFVLELSTFSLNDPNKSKVQILYLWSILLFLLSLQISCRLTIRGKKNHLKFYPSKIDWKYLPILGMQPSLRGLGWYFKVHAQYPVTQ